MDKRPLINLQLPDSLKHFSKEGPWWRFSVFLVNKFVLIVLFLLAEATKWIHKLTGWW